VLKIHFLLIQTTTCEFNTPIIRHAYPTTNYRGKGKNIQYHKQMNLSNQCKKRKNETEIEAERVRKRGREEQKERQREKQREGVLWSQKIIINSMKNSKIHSNN